jgi:hypothetical protein
MIERSHPAFRNMAPIEQRCGRFSVEEIRQLVPQDLRKLGCPEATFLSILEHRAEDAKREGRSFRPLPVTAAEWRDRAAAMGEEIAADDSSARAREVLRKAPEALRINPKVWES